ncbi:MAG: GatB/YqeY domain-containing protein [Legionella sp.]|uniref:GatB/YqeY domain-containing protein n=1 Tax=Legionella sp. TaxID=459 RepID=UPI00284C16E8|nr:GatB/YqeY domain-containing protein [Legionella sp.]
MTLLERIKADSVFARKARNPISSALLTTLYSEASMVGKNNGNRLSTDEEVVAVVKKFIKNTEEILSIRPSKVANIEIGILKEYVPTQLTESELRSIIQIVKDDGGNISAVMKYLKQDYAGRYDSKLASQLAK